MSRRCRRLSWLALVCTGSVKLALGGEGVQLIQELGDCFFTLPRVHESKYSHGQVDMFPAVCLDLRDGGFV